MSDKGFFISDFDNSAIRAHSVLELGGAVIEYLGSVGHPEHKYLKNLYEKLKSESSGTNGYCGHTGIMKNKAKMEMLSEYISNLPVESLNRIQNKIKKSEVDGFSDAVNYARKSGLKPHIITMSFDYLVKDLSEKWGCSYDSNKIVLDKTGSKVEKIKLMIPDEMKKADLIEKMVGEYIKANGHFPDMHIYGDGESDIPMFKKVRELENSGRLGKAFIYVPLNGTEEARKLATNVFSEGELKECIRKNRRLC